MKSENPLISIILPVYNTRDYLGKCLDSILAQTYTNLEIICIDDGCTDGSELILNKYAEKDGRIKLIRQKNIGESGARNTGLRNMKGRYVGFIDCDDWIEPDMYEKLVTAMMNNDVDIVASSWYYDTNTESKRIKNDCTVNKGVFGREEFLGYLFKRDSYRAFGYMWNKLYRRELFYDRKEQLLLFDEDLLLGGDVVFLAKLAINSNRVFYIDEAFYHYNQRMDSGSHTKDLSKKMGMIESYRRVIEYFEINGVERDIMVWVKRFLAYHSSNIAQMAYEQGNENVLVNCQKVMKQNWNEYYSTNVQYKDRIERYKTILEYKLGL